MDRSGFFGYLPSETPSAARRPEADNGRHPFLCSCQGAENPSMVRITIIITKMSILIKGTGYFFEFRLQDFKRSDSKIHFHSSKGAIQNRPIFWGQGFPAWRLRRARVAAQPREMPKALAASAAVTRSLFTSVSLTCMLFRRLRFTLPLGERIFIHSVMGAYQYRPLFWGHGFPDWWLLRASCAAYSGFSPNFLAASAAVIISFTSNTCSFQ